MQHDTDPPKVPQPSQSGTQRGINLPELMARVGGDKELLRDLCEVFNTELPGMVALVEKAIAAEDAVAISRAAHGLKGAVSVFGRGPAFSSALAVEMAARNSRLDEARTVFQTLLKDLEALKTEVAELGSRVSS